MVKKMMMRFLILLMVVFFVLGDAHANMNTNYNIENVAVDIESESAVSARDKALVVARRNAFNVLKSRLLSGTHVIEADDRQIAMMVDSFEINREKLSKNRYLASVNVRFNERAVNSFLSRQPMSRHTNNDLSFLDGVLGGHDTMMTSPQNKMDHNQENHVGGRSFSYDIVTTIHGLRDYMAIKNQLSRIPMIKSLRLVSLSSQKLVLSVDYQGGAQQFQNDLVSRGMQLYSNPRVVNGEAPYILIRRG